jgi:VIT1/CCC1 family predicted Fe2+/Mn2+ transporter
MEKINAGNIKLLLEFQKNEISEHIIYTKLSQLEKKENNRLTLSKIAADELRHYNIWKNYTGQEVEPDRFKIWWYLLLAKIFGITFSIKLMENGEKGAQKTYSGLLGSIPEAEKIIRDENEHERGLVTMVDEERLKYMGSVVLGLNDALVELTGTLAGLTFALQNSKIVGVAGLITGIAAALSMAASEYLSTKTDPGEKNPLRASIYTGITYILAVAVLIIPFLTLTNQYLSLLVAFLGAIILIWLFTFYCSVVTDVPFKKRFTEMLIISMGVAFLSFVIGLLAKQLLGVNL